jgi:hypothetical protein
MIIFAAAAMSLVAASVPASAEQWPWCANLKTGRNDMARNCGFANLQQCEATVSGIGGYCERNPFYRGEPPRRRAHRYRER